MEGRRTVIHPGGAGRFGRFAHGTGSLRVHAMARWMLLVLLLLSGGWEAAADPGFATPGGGETAAAGGCGPGLEPVPIDGDVLCSVGAEPLIPGYRESGPVKPIGADAKQERVSCIGDGLSGPRIQLIYVYERSSGNRYAQFAANFQVAASDMDQIFRSSAQQSGGVRRLRMVTNAACAPLVAIVEVPDGSLATFGGSITAVRSAGYTRMDRNYAMFVDTNIYCGIGTIRADSSSGQGNLNNLGGAYARVDNACWGGFAMAHEVMHGLGAVQLDAPNSSGAWHCTDERDVMCYSDQGANTPPMRLVCNSGAWAAGNFFDCNNDDYFDAGPSPSGYLATHWNTANSVFLDQSAGQWPGAIAVQPGSGPVGGKVSVILTAFKPGTGIQLLFDGAKVDSAIADGNGAVTMVIQTPQKPGGAYLVTAESIDTVAQMSFHIVPALQVSPRRVTTGQLVSVRVTGFKRGEVVTISLGTRQLLKAAVRQDGTLDTSVRIPKSSSGSLGMTAVGSAGSRASETMTIKRARSHKQ